MKDSLRITKWLSTANECEDAADCLRKYDIKYTIIEKKRKYKRYHNDKTNKDMMKSVKRFAVYRLDPFKIIESVWNRKK